MTNRAAVTPALLEEYCTKFRNWGRWGPEDEIGTLNFITPDVIKRAATLVRQGKVISCALSFDMNGPQTGAFGRVNPLHSMVATGTDHAAGRQRLAGFETLPDLDEVFRIFPVLRARLRQLAGTLSGGEGQMLAIARALMAKPRLLLLDEPSVGLMPKAVTEIFEMVRSIPERGVTVLLVEQNARKALSVAQRVAVLELGRVVLEGDVAEMADDPRIKEAYLGG